MENLDLVIIVMVRDFRQRAIQFGAAQIKRRLSEHYESFKRINVVEDHFFYDSSKAVIILQYLLGDKDEKTITSVERAEIVKSLDLLQHEVKQLKSVHFRGLMPFLISSPSPLDIFKYLSKITRLSEYISVLLNAAYSPHLENIFRTKNLVTTL